MPIDTRTAHTVTIEARKDQGYAAINVPNGMPVTGEFDDWAQYAHAHANEVAIELQATGQYKGWQIRAVITGNGGTVLAKSGPQAI